MWLHGEFPWLGAGFIQAVAEDHMDGFAAQLIERDSSCARCEAMAHADVFTRLGRALEFPTYHGGSGRDASTIARAITCRRPVLGTGLVDLVALEGTFHA